MEQARLKKEQDEANRKAELNRLEREHFERALLKEEKPAYKIEEPYEEPTSKRNWYIGGGILAVFITVIMMMQSSKTDNSLKPNTSTNNEITSPLVTEPQKPVFDKQKFEYLMQDIDGALTAGDKETAQQSINAAKQMSPNDPRIAEYERRLKKLK